MINHYILNDQKEIVEVPLMEWVEWIEHTDKRFLKSSKVGEIKVSSIFLGLDYSFGGKEPLYFETMIFGGKREGEIERYSTYDETMKRHEEIVKELYLA